MEALLVQKAFSVSCGHGLNGGQALKGKNHEVAVAM